MLVALVLFVNFRLRDSRLGRAWIAIREDEVAAASMGVPLVKTKLLAYATGAAFGGIVGRVPRLLPQRRSTPTSSSSAFSIFILAMIILGGLGSIWGVVLGAIAAVVHQHVLHPRRLQRRAAQARPGLRPHDLTSGSSASCIVLMMVLRPQGLLPERRRKLELTEGIGADDAIEVDGAP